MEGHAFDLVGGLEYSMLLYVMEVGGCFVGLFVFMTNQLVAFVMIIVGVVCYVTWRCQMEWSCIVGKEMGND